MTEAIEVIARLGETIVDVRYVTDGRYSIGTHHFDVDQLANPHAVRIGLVELSLRCVDRPRPTALRPAFERRLLSYLAGSLVFHLAVWALAQSSLPVVGAPVSDYEFGALYGDTFDVDTRNWEPGSSADLDDNGTSAPLRDVAGLSGSSHRELQGRIQLAEQHGTPTLTRVQAIEAARHAGVLGSAAMRADGFSAIVGTGDLITGFDQNGSNDVPLFDQNGEVLGTWGQARSGKMFGGSCDSCGTIVGTGRYGTTGEITTGRLMRSGARDLLQGKHQVKPPMVIPCAGPRPCVVEGELDKAIVRRYIKREMPKLQYCYEKQLLAEPALAGTLTAQFLIATDGTVQAVRTEGVAEPVNDCVAGVIKNIKFPRSIREATQVTYPLTFRVAGS